MKNAEVFSSTPVHRPGTGLPDPRILSIAIVTHDRVQKLQQLLNSISGSQLIHELLSRIIIVDDSPGRMNFNAKSPAMVDYVWLPERIFITRAKNIAWKRAITPLILFIDDDNVIKEESVLHLLKVIEKHPEIGALMPSVSYLSQPGRIWVYSAPFRKGRWSMDLTGRNSVEKVIPDYDLMSTDALPNAFIIRRSILFSVSGFDEEFTHNNSCDLCQRIKLSGHEVYASAVSRFYHDVQPPNHRGYWADHVVADRDRAFPESRDWTLLMRKIHGKKSMRSPLLYLHLAWWILQVDLGIILMGTPPGNFIGINVAFLKGFLTGARVKIFQYYDDERD